MSYKNRQREEKILAHRMRKIVVGERLSQILKLNLKEILKKLPAMRELSYST